MRRDRGVPRQLAPPTEAGLDRVVAFLRVALGLGQVDRPREAVREAAAHEPVELRLERPARLSRSLVACELDRDARAARARRRVTARIGAEALAQPIRDLGRRHQAQRKRYQAGADRLEQPRRSGCQEEKHGVDRRLLQRL